MTDNLPEEHHPHHVHHDYTVRARGASAERALRFPALAKSHDSTRGRTTTDAPFLQPPAVADQADGEVSHPEGDRDQFKCTEQGAKSAMSRRGITECLDWVHEGNAWKAKTKSAT